MQHSIGSPSDSNQTRKRSKRHPNWKGESKNLIDADDIIGYIENPIDSTQKLLGLKSEFGKASEYKVNIQKSKAFLYIAYTNNELSERETRGENPI